MRADIQFAIQFIVGGVFVYSGLAKLRSPMRFVRGVIEYDVVPGLVAVVGGLLVIPLELYLGTAHLTSWTITLAGPIGCVVLLLFAIAVSVNLARGRSLPCYCFGAEKSDFLSIRSLARLLLMIIGEIIVSIRPRSPGYSSTFSIIQTWDHALVLLILATAFFLAAIWSLQAATLVCLLPRALTRKVQIVSKMCIPFSEHDEAYN